MNKLIRMICAYCLLWIGSFPSYAQGNDGLGQTIQIYARFRSVVGKPQWLLVIRDIDRGQVIPYLFDVTEGDNFWVALTYSRNYLITASSMQFEPYKRRHIHDFCHLESNGRIIRGQSLYVTINGRLSPNTDTFCCRVSQYADANFTVTSLDQNSD
jgi:hypothetical protein